MGRPYHLRENIPSGLSPDSKYVSFCKFFRKSIYISNSSLSIWSGISTWQCNWKNEMNVCLWFYFIASQKKAPYTNALVHFSTCQPWGGEKSEGEGCSVVSTLCDPIDYTVPGILQARILEWVAFPLSRGSSQPRSPHCRWILHQLSHREAHGMGRGAKYELGQGNETTVLHHFMYICGESSEITDFLKYFYLKTFYVLKKNWLEYSWFTMLY